MKIYEIVYGVDSTKHYIAQIKADNPRQLAGLLAENHVDKAINFRVIKITDTDCACILNTREITKDLYETFRGL